MSEQNLRDMHLDVEQAWTTVRFLQAYANTALAELESLSSPGPPGNETSAAGPAWNQDPGFSIAADAASSLREAGQWLLYLDPAGAAVLLARAGRLFRDMGQPFGLYLLAVAGEADRDLTYQMVGLMLD